MLVSGFDTISDQQQPIRLLKAFLRKGTIPHALLFSGIEGVGKRTVALYFAMACLCRQDDENPRRPQSQNAHEKAGEDRLYTRLNDPCTRCRTCRRIESGNHPDVIHIQPSGAFIRIGQIRSLCETLSLKPLEDGLRVVIISNAQTMNAEAGNALLKVLEEPPERTILVLTALQTSDLLPTVVSRCQQVRFNPVTAASIARLLIEKEKVPPQSAGIIAALAHGSVAKAKKMAKTDWVAKRGWLLSALGLDHCGNAAPSPRSGMAFAEKLASDKQALEDSLEVIKTYLRDVLVFAHAPHMVINQDMQAQIKAAASRIPASLVLDRFRSITAAERAVYANANLRLTLEVMAMRLMGQYHDG
jgi:DNA polymerase-3 subunit delta'